MMELDSKFNAELHRLVEKWCGDSKGFLLKLPSLQERQLVFSFMDRRDICHMDTVMMTSDLNKRYWREALADAFSPALSNYPHYSNDSDDFKSLRWCLNRRINLDGLRLSRIKIDGGSDLTHPVKQFDWLVKNGKADIAKCLIQSGAVDPNRVSGGFSLLNLASYHGMLDVVECLINLGAKLDRKVTKTGATSIHLASQRGHVGVMKALIDAGIDFNKADKTKKTPLHHACANHHIEAILYLIQQAGAEVDTGDNEDDTPLITAAGSFVDNNSAVMQVQALIHAGADVNHGNRSGRTALAAACRMGDQSTVECLLEAGADVNKGDKNGVSPLYLACEEGHVRCCQVLLRDGAQFDHVSADGGTCLGIASEKGHASCVQALLSAGAEVDRINSACNLTPLHLACLGGHSQVVEVLLASGASINHKGGRRTSCEGSGGTTPLGCALEVKCNAVVTLLRSRGAHT